MAEELVGHCDRVKAALAGEAAPEPARHFVGRAKEGWLAVAANSRVTAPQWDAMRGLLAGGAPVWHDAKGRQGEAGKRAKDAGAWVGQMQLRVAAHVRAHRDRGAAAARWVQQRVQHRPLLQQVFSSWATLRSGRRHGPDERLLSATEWAGMRAGEGRAARQARRRREGVKRFLHFAAQLRPQIQKMKLRGVLRGKLSRAIATARRRERARARWTVALRWVRGVLLQTAGRRKARTSARTATLVATASSLDRAAAPARRRVGVRAPPARPQLRRAALCGPVLLRIVDAYDAYVALGDG